MTMSNPDPTTKPKPSEQVTGEQLGPALRWLAGFFLLGAVVLMAAAAGLTGDPVGLVFALPTLLGVAIGAGIIAALGSICENVAVMRRLRERQG